MNWRNCELAQLRVLDGQPRHPVDHVDHQVEAVEVVQHHHVERRGGGAARRAPAR